MPRVTFGTTDGPHPTPEEPIRSELFGAERLELHGASLAAAQTVVAGPFKGRPLLPRVEENGRILRETYRVIAKALREKRTIVPAAEWLVDNFYIVDEQLREIRADLPPGFYRELPKLAAGHWLDTRASTASRGRSSHTPTAASTPTSCVVSSTPISTFNR